MLDPISDPPESAEHSVPRSTREKQRWRNAAARWKHGAIGNFYANS